MPRHHIRALLVSSLLLSTACTQEPARVDNNGSHYFGRDGSRASQPATIAYRSSKYAPIKQAQSDYKPYQPAPVYTNTVARSSATTNVSQSTEQRASLQSIGVSDLPPPSSSPSAAKAKPESSNAAKKPANPWTKQEREESHAAPEEKPATIMAKEEPAKPAKAVAAKTSSTFMWPVNARKVVSAFGPKSGGKVNDGMNIASAEGEPVWASADGEVVYVGNELKGYGNMVLIKHSGNKTTSYAHLNRATVDKYDRVKQGDIIGYVGSTGNVKTPQLHFAIRDGKAPVDPKKYLTTNVAGL